MSTRLQVIVSEKELAEIQETAQRHGMTMAEWVRQAMRAARRADTTGQTKKKLAAVQSAAANAFPTADIDKMLSEIEVGYLAPTRG